MPRPHMALWASGIARTKGSLRVIGYRHSGSPVMGEAVTGSGEWRRVVAAAFLHARGAEPGPGGWSGGVAPLCGPVRVVCAVALPRPSTGHGASSEWPDTPGRNDLDKLERNIGDALTDAGVIDDDARIVHWDASKVWAPTPFEVGAWIEVWDLTGTIGA